MIEAPGATWSASGALLGTEKRKMNTCKGALSRRLSIKVILKKKHAYDGRG
jgi:hypothetical protein